MNVDELQEYIRQKSLYFLTHGEKLSVEDVPDCIGKDSFVSNLIFRLNYYLTLYKVKQTEEDKLDILNRTCALMPSFMLLRGDNDDSSSR